MPPKQPDNSSTWYDDGLRFTCTQCGNCCTGPAGFVWFDDDEAKRMAEHLGLDEATFRDRYAHKTFSKWTLDEVENDKGEYDCIFLNTDEDGRRTCSIYEVRPLQCRTWPFWPENLKSQTSYVRAGSRCPGMQAGLEGEGKLYSVDQIRIIRDRQRQSQA